MITYTQHGLFPQLPVPTQAWVLKTLSPHYPWIWHSCHEMFNDLTDYRAHDRNFTSLTEDECAVILTMLISHRVEHHLDGKQGFRLARKHKKLVVLIGDELELTFKKITKRAPRPGVEPFLQRSNYPTFRNVGYYNQEVRLGIIDVPRIVIGYELLKEVTTMIVRVAYPRSLGKGFEWTRRIPSQANNAPIVPKIYIRPTPATDEPEKGYTVELPAKTKEEGKDS